MQKKMVKESGTFKLALSFLGCLQMPVKETSEDWLYHKVIYCLLNKKLYIGASRADSATFMMSCFIWALSISSSFPWSV